MTALVADAACLRHDPGPGHPETPARFEAVWHAFEAAGYLQGTLRLEPVAPTLEDLRAVHSSAYLELAEREVRAGASQLTTGDTNLSAGSWEAACHGVGSGFAAVDAVCEGRAQNAFCLVRPPGHHATPERGMGFCLLNNVALAARRAQRKHGLERVLIADWDVHHGNGTQDAFYEDGSVFFFSTHQSPWYPGTGRADETGRGRGRGATLNCPLPAGSGRKEIFAVFEEQLLPAAEKFKPELILISAGFDSRLHDPLGQFTLVDQDFAQLTQMLKELAGRHSHGRIVSLLEGGYSLSGLASAATAHVAALRAEV